MKLRALSRARWAGVQLAITLAATACVVLCVAFMVKTAADWGAGRDTDVQLAIGAFVAFGAFLSMLVALVPDFIRYPVVLCSRIDIDQHRIKGISAAGRTWIDAEWKRINAGPGNGQVTRLTVILDVPRRSAIHLPLFLFSPPDRAELVSKLARIVERPGAGLEGTSQSKTGTQDTGNQDRQHH